MTILKDYMGFKYVVPFNIDGNDKKILLVELLKLLREKDDFLHKDQFIDSEIRKNFSISDFGNPNDVLKVKGISFILEGFIEEINQFKMDVSLTHNEVEFLGFTDDNEISLKFSNASIGGANDIFVKGISSGKYNSTNECFRSWFDLGSKHIDFCLKDSRKEQVVNFFTDYINKMFKALPDDRRQYRLLLDPKNIGQESSELLLRGVTSEGYKNYDNNVVLYLCLLFLHKYAVKTGNHFKFTGGYVSDSDIKASFELEKPKRLKHGEEVYIGLVMSNNEIRKGVVSFTMYYKIVHEGYSFKGIVKDPICEIVHTSGIEKLQQKLQELLKLDEHEIKMLNYIDRVAMTDKLSEDMIFYLFKSIKSSELSSDTKSEAESKKQAINSTMTIIQILDRLSDITTDVNELIHLQRIYDDVIKHLSEKVTTEGSLNF